MSDSFVSPRLEIGRVIKQTVDAIAANPASILLLSLAVNVASVGLSAAVRHAASGLDFNPVVSALSGVPSLFVTLFLTVLLQTAITVIVIEHLNGRRASTGQALGAVSRLAVPVLLLSLAVALGLVVGFVLFIVPGIILLVRWSVAVPAQVVEGRGVGASLSRSAELSKGYRWKILLLFVIYCVFVLALVLLSSLLVGGMLEMALRRMTFDPAALVISVIEGTITSATSSTLGAVIYTELRRIKEGALPSQLAAVFE